MASNFYTAGAAAMTSNDDSWTTPAWLFEMLDSEFHFNLDAASTHENALCDVHYTEEDDGLAQPWEGSVWCNPPYGRSIGAWVRKAAESNPNGVTVMLVPARTETTWFKEWVYPHATEIRFIYGRLKFGDATTSAPFPSVVVVYDRRPKPWRAVTL